MREGEREGRGRERGRGERGGRESLGGKGGRREKGRGGEGKFRGARPPQMFFPRTAPAKSV